MLKKLFKKNGSNKQVQKDIQEAFLALQKEAIELKKLGKQSTYTDERGINDVSESDINSIGSYDDNSFFRGFGSKKSGLNPLKSNMSMYGMPTNDEISEAIKGGN